MGIFSSSGKTSGKNGGNFELLSRLDFIVFGNYSNGLPNPGVQSIENSLMNFLELKKLISDCAKGSYAKWDFEHNKDYDIRMDFIVRKKVKGFLVCILPASEHNKLEKLKEQYELSSIDLYDPNDSNILFPDRKYAIAASNFKYNGDFRLYCDAGTRIPQSELVRLVKILEKYHIVDNLPQFQGYGYRLSKRSD